MFNASRMRFVALTAITLTVGVGLSASAGSPVTDAGLLLTGTHAAYAWFTTPIDECHGLGGFVGYVEADRLKAPLGNGRPSFHTDVEAQLGVFENAETEGCGSDSLQLSGGRGVTESDQVEMVTLESAFVHNFELTIEGVEGSDPVTAQVIITLDWTGDDDIRTETFHTKGDHTSHRTVDATIAGTLTINSVTGGGELAELLSGFDGAGVGPSDMQEAQITRYQQIIIGLP